MEIRFLTLDEVIEIHQEMIDRYGRSAGIRDQGLLESAVASPQAGFGDQYLHVDVFEMAAAYLFHITMNHPLLTETSGRVPPRLLSFSSSTIVRSLQARTNLRSSSERLRKEI